MACTTTTSELASQGPEDLKAPALSAATTPAAATVTSSVVLIEEYKDINYGGGAPAQRQLNVRIPRKLYGDCEAAASAAGLKLRPWVESVLLTAVQKSNPF